MRLEAEGSPDPPDRGGRQSRVTGHPGPRPVRGPLGRGLQGVDDDLLDLLHPDHRRPARPGLVNQPVKTTLNEPAAPLAHRRQRHPQLPGHLGVRGPRRRRQHDPAPQRQRLGGLAPPR